MGNRILNGTHSMGKAVAYITPRPCPFSDIHRSPFSLKLRRAKVDKKGQGTLESATIFFMLMLLLGGIVKMWFWANNQIVKRQIEYNQTRVVAGTSVDGYTQVWPVYQPDELTEDIVLLGEGK